MTLFKKFLQKSINYSSMRRLTVETRLHDSIFFIKLNRAEKKNCVNHATAKLLVDAIQTLHDTDSAKVGILYGDGGTFCAGYDLQEVASGNFEHIDGEFLQNYRYMGPTGMQINKPLIAAIDGYAVAGGLELSLLADIRLCTPRAIFGVFCRKHGVPLIDGGTVRLPRIIGLGRAMDMILTGRAVNAHEALSYGLVTKVCENVVDEATKMAQLIASHPQECLLADRRSTYHSLHNSLEDSLQFELNSCSVLDKSIGGAQKFISRKSKM